MKKAMLVLITVLSLTSVALSGCSSCGKEIGTDGGDGITVLGGLEIAVNDVYFEESVVSDDWLIVELTLKNKGGEAEYLLFAPYSRFYIEDSRSQTYSLVNTYACAASGNWKRESPLVQLLLESGATQVLTLQFFGIPKDARSLRLFCRESVTEAGKKVSISLNPRAKEGEPASSDLTQETAPTIEPTSGSPGEAIVKFYTLLSEERYPEAEKLVTPEFLEAIESMGGLAVFKEYLGDRKIEKIEIIREEEDVDGDYVFVDFSIYFDDGSKETVTGSRLKKIENEWKLAD